MTSTDYSSSNTMSASTKSSDPAWNYVELPDHIDKNTIKCKFCGKVTKGGIHRAKQHLAGGLRNAKCCERYPEPIRQEMKKFLQKKKNDKDERHMEPLVEYEIGEGYDDEPLAEPPTTKRKGHSGFSSGVRFKGPKRKGPLDVLFAPYPEAIVRKAKGKQLMLNEMDNATKKELRSRACTMFARWMYDAGIPFNVASYDSFKAFVEAVGQYGPGMKPPTPHEVRVPLLKQEVENTRKMMKDHQQVWAQYGCSVLSDGLKDRREMTLINFLINSPKGSMFYKSVDASTYAKTGDKIFELLSGIVEEIGVGNVIQVVTDSASNNVLAGKLLETKYPTLFWTPCAAHCIDLILEDIFKVPNVKKTFERAVMVTSYIYTRPGLVNMLRKFTNNKELLRPAKTRFATAFITLGRMNKLQSNLRKMFTSDEWRTSKWAKEAVGKKVLEVILMPTFWSNMVFALKVASPLVRVLRLVDDERKPAMGYIYKAMDRAKEVIAASFNGDEARYASIFRIIDNRWDVQLHRPLHAAGWYLNPEYFCKSKDEIHEEVKIGFYECLRRLVPDPKMQDQIDNELPKYWNAEGLFGNYMAIRKRAEKSPAEWWNAYGDSAPALKKFAIKILSLTCSSSGCERNWSMFENLHTKRRNRLAQSRLKDLVFVKYNRALRRRYEMRDTIDPIALTDIDESNEWLIGRLDQEDDKDDENVLLNDDGLTWGNVAMAVGVGEPSYKFRSKSGSSSKQPTKTRQPIVEEEEEEFQGFDAEEEEEREGEGFPEEEGEDEEMGEEEDDFDDDLEDSID